MNYRSFKTVFLRGWLLALIERSKDGNLVSNVTLIYCNMEENLEKWVN